AGAVSGRHGRRYVGNGPLARHRHQRLGSRPVHVSAAPIDAGLYKYPALMDLYWPQPAFDGIKDRIGNIRHDMVTKPAARAIAEPHEGGAHESQRASPDSVPQSRLLRMFLCIRPQWKTIG